MPEVFFQIIGNGQKQTSLFTITRIDLKPRDEVYKRQMMKRLAVFVIILLMTSTLCLAKEIDYKRLYSASSKAVVVLYGTDGKTASKGTGSIIDTNGLVLTNTHVVRNKDRLWDRQYIILKPEKITGNTKKDLKYTYEGSVLAINPEFDLALVQIVNPPSDLHVLPLSELKEVGIGEPTVAIGHPGGGALWTLTTGKIGASWESYKGIPGWDLFQTETPINPGNSGGPLLDGSGSIIGINTFIIRKATDGMALTGLNFAVKSTVARDWILSVLGKLPKASSIKPTTQLKQPDAVSTLKAPPPKPLKENKKKGKITARQLANESLDMKGRPNQLKRPPKRKPREYTTRIRPGQSFSGDKLKELFQRVDAAFDELDKETADY